MTDIPLGATGVFSLTVEPEHLANRFKNPSLPAVLATPVLIMAMENAALNAIEAYLEPGESALGTRIDVSHMAPTPLGMVVFAEAKLARIDGRRLEFKVTATDEVEQIGRATHQRVIVDRARLAKRLDAKRAR
jgi:fluoroacetyl-CoA thioesterase